MICTMPPGRYSDIMRRFSQQKDPKLYTVPLLVFVPVSSCLRWQRIGLALLAQRYRDFGIVLGVDLEEVVQNDQQH